MATSSQCDAWIARTLYYILHHIANTYPWKTIYIPLLAHENSVRTIYSLFEICRSIMQHLVSLLRFWDYKCFLGSYPVTSL